MNVYSMIACHIETHRDILHFVYDDDDDDGFWLENDSNTINLFDLLGLKVVRQIKLRYNQRERTFYLRLVACHSIYIRIYMILLFL